MIAQVDLLAGGAWVITAYDAAEDRVELHCGAVVLSPRAEAWFLRGRLPACCAVCRAVFVPSRRGQRYCSPACQRRGRRG